jgi:tight adherence protein B
VVLTSPVVVFGFVAVGLLLLPRGRAPTRVERLVEAGRLNASARPSRHRPRPRPLVAHRPDEPARLVALRSAIEVVAAELDAGSRPEAAFRAAQETVPACAQDLQVLVVAAGGGQPPEAPPSGDMSAVWRAWIVGSTSGAALADVLRRAGADLAARAEQHRRVAAALAGPTASAGIVAGLPLLGLALGAGLGVHPVSVLFGSPGGRATAALGLIFDLAGVAWTRRILRAARRQ